MKMPSVLLFCIVAMSALEYFVTAAFIQAEPTLMGRVSNRHFKAANIPTERRESIKKLKQKRVGTNFDAIFMNRDR